MIQKALKYDLEVMADGRVELQVPFPVGTRVTVVVIEEPANNFNDLASAAQNSLDFCYNPYDDEDWNNT